MASICLPAGDVFVSVKIEEDNLFGGILQLLSVIRPTWLSEHIKFKIFTDGITNKLVACEYNNGGSNSEKIVLVRIYGHKTDLLIDRNAELRNIKVLNVLNLAPEIYGIFENGLAYEYFPGVTLDVDTVTDSKIWPLVARQMAKMHKVELGTEINKEPMVWDKIEQFLSLLPEPFTDKLKNKKFVKSFGSVTKLRIEFERLKSHLGNNRSPIVFAHNDLLLGNVIYNEEKGTVSFIDYEYAAYNHQAFDIANHFNEFVGLSIEDIDYSRYPTKEFRARWIRAYLSEYLNDTEPSDSDVERVCTEVEQLSLASHFLWAIWSLVQYELSSIEFDFGRYAEIRLNRYFQCKEKVFKQFS